MRILKLKQHHSAFESVKMSLNIHQKIIFTFVLINLIVFMYDGIFHLAIEIFHGLFESIEHLLDLLVEHILEFSTEAAPQTHETQVIVFYILISFILLGLYRFYRFLPRWYDTLKNNLHQQKLTVLSEWHRLPLLQRFEWWSFFVIYISCVIFFSF